MRLSITCLLITTGSFASAQCDHEVIISPDQIDMLCPGEEVTLMTGIFDSYQWYMDGEPIDGATDPSHIVTWYESGAPYTVAATLNGCTEMSEEVWVDGHNWGFPWVASGGGDEPVAIGPNGEPIMCEGQVLELEMSPAFVVVNWTMDGVLIPGAEENTLSVTEAGNYGATIYPAVCPSLVQELEVTIDVTFLDPQQPAISAIDDQLCAFPPGNTYTWYLNGEELPEDGACTTMAGAGAYTVYVDYGQNCQMISEPYLSTSITANEHHSTWMLYPNPSNGSINIAMDAELSAGAFYTVFDAAGRQVTTGWMPLNGLLQLDLQKLEAGIYMFQAARNGKALAPASRFTIVK